MKVTIEIETNHDDDIGDILRSVVRNVLDSEPGTYLGEIDYGEGANVSTRYSYTIA